MFKGQLNTYNDEAFTHVFHSVIHTDEPGSMLIRVGNVVIVDKDSPNTSYIAVHRATYTLSEPYIYELDIMNGMQLPLSPVATYAVPADTWFLVHRLYPAANQAEYVLFYNDDNQTLDHNDYNTVVYTKKIELGEKELYLSKESNIYRNNHWFGYDAAGWDLKFANGHGRYNIDYCEITDNTDLCGTIVFTGDQHEEIIHIDDQETVNGIEYRKNINTDTDLKPGTVSTAQVSFTCNIDTAINDGREWQYAVGEDDWGGTLEGLDQYIGYVPYNVGPVESRIFLTEKKEIQPGMYSYTGYDSTYKTDQSADEFLTLAAAAEDNKYVWNKSSISEGTESTIELPKGDTAQYFIDEEVQISDDGTDTIEMVNPKYSVLAPYRANGTLINTTGDKVNNIVFHIPVNTTQYTDTVLWNDFNISNIDYNATAEKGKIVTTSTRTVYWPDSRGGLADQTETSTYTQWRWHWPEDVALQQMFTLSNRVAAWEAEYSGNTGINTTYLAAYQNSSPLSINIYFRIYKNKPDWYEVTIAGGGVNRWTEKYEVIKLNDLTWTNNNGLYLNEHGYLSTYAGVSLNIQNSDFVNKYLSYVNDDTIYKIKRQHVVSSTGALQVTIAPVTMRSQGTYESYEKDKPLHGFEEGIYYSITEIPAISTVCDLFESIAKWLDIYYIVTEEMRAKAANNFIIQNKFTDINKTFRDLLEYIAEVYGGFCHVNRYGAMIIDFYFNRDVLIDNSIYVNVTKSKYNTKLLNKIVVQTNSDSNYFKFGSGENALTIKDNPLLLVENTNVLTNICVDMFTYLNELAVYNPSTITLPNNNLWIFPGTKIRFVDADGIATETFVFSKTIQDNQVILECTGNEKRDAVKDNRYKTINNVNGSYSKSTEDVKEIKFEVGDTSSDITYRLYVNSDGVWAQRNNETPVAIFQ